MNIDSINSGYVIDHIKAGRSMDIYKHLKLDELSCSVAIIKNVKSSKMGKKDIIKIDSLINLDLTVLGFIDPGITVNVIKDGKLLEKKPISQPEKIVNVLKCKNPRCITSAEPQLDSIFLLTKKADGSHTYRCAYCDTERKK